MYPTTTEFKRAIRENKPQLCLMFFDNLFFSNEDIVLETGVNLTDVFCSGDDLSIGQAISNELSFELFNDNKLLNDFDFGEFFATIGVLVSSETTKVGRDPYIMTPNGAVFTVSTAGKIQKNGITITRQPTFTTGTLVYKDKYVFCISEDFTQAVKFDPLNISELINVPILPFMRDKLSRIGKCGILYDANTLKIWVNRTLDTYEFVPLGRFIAEKPNVTDINRISIVCNDVMTKFEMDVPSDEELEITYPITLKNLLKLVCDFAEVEVDDFDFINSDIVVSKRPEEFNNSTLRNVVAWIAEASCSNARINRDGKLVLDWLSNSLVTLEETDYADFKPYWYTVPKVDKLYNRDTVKCSENTIGEGGNCYLIQDNPFLKGAT